MKKTRIYIIIMMLVITILLTGCSHKHNYQFLEVFEPTCTTQGYTIYECECKEFIKKDFTDPLGHIEVIDEGKEATCIQTGLTQGSHCERCGKVILKQELIPFTNHKLGNYVVDKEPTETQIGQISKHCEICGERFDIKHIEYEPSILTYSLNAEGTGYIITGFIEEEFNKTNFTIPETHHSMAVTEIGEKAFENCTVLKSVYIPNSIKVIGDGAFKGCTNLESVRFPKQLTILGNEIFMNCSSIVELKLTEFLQSIGTQTFANCTSLKKIIMPDTVSTIGEYAFINCINLESFDIPKSLTKISKGMFSGCINLCDIELIDSITNIEEDAFFNCKKINFTTFPKQLLTIGNSAFGNCTSIKVIILGENLESIGEYCFSGCTSLENLFIPKSVTFVGKTILLNSPAATIVCEAEAQPETWDENWNSTNNIVAWGG